VPTVDDVGKAAVGLRADTVAWVAALAIAALFALVVWHLRREVKHEEKVAALNATMLGIVREHTAQLVAIYSGSKRPRRREAADVAEEEKP